MNSAFRSIVPVCGQLCTNSFAGEGLGGIAGGGFVISIWDVPGVGVWSENLGSTFGFVLDDAGFFLLSVSQWTEIEIVCVRGWEGMGFLCGGGEVSGGDPVAWALGFGSIQELRWEGGSGMVTGVSLREDTLRSCVLAVPDALTLLESFETADWLSCWSVLTLVSEYE